MSKLSFSQVEQNVAQIANRASYTEDFLYELLAAYGRSKSSIIKLKSGDQNKAATNGEVLQKDVVYFKVYPKGAQLEPEVYLANDLVKKWHPRYIITTDLENMAAKDLKKGETLSIAIRDIDRHVPFFYGWTGNEVIEDKEESALDRRVADCMKDLYDSVEAVNRIKLADPSLNFRHELNVFFGRLLFCMFAEDTNLFAKHQFSDAIKNFTEADGSDLREFLGRLFTALDTKDKSFMGQPFASFPYVNGSIFDIQKHGLVVPEFSPEARFHLLRCTDFNWGGINPDIFGTIFQGIVDKKRRNENGMDYTSVSNINKVIEPLFMDDLDSKFEKSFEGDGRVKDANAARIKNLEQLWDRISKIKIFDPACGSGNFLIISYKRLRELELRILREIRELKGLTGRDYFRSRIKLENFYGIELEDFPRELAILSMYIAEHQMNIEFNEEFGKEISMFPIQDQPHIVCGNAARLDWQDVCPNRPHQIQKAPEQNHFTLGESMLDGDNILTPSENDVIYDEIYVIGNPPYKGADEQSDEQKNDLRTYFNREKYSANMDYIGLWFIKGARYISGTNAKLAFVSTNSVCQGEHVGIMFPKIMDEAVEINFAVASFKWSNNAKDNSQVMVIILGLQSKGANPKRLFHNGVCDIVEHISPYLIPRDDLIVRKSNKPISSDFPPMVFGSMPRTKDLVVTAQEREEILTAYPEASRFIRKYLGADEYIKGKDRYALWIEDRDVLDARAIPEIDRRLHLVAEARSKSKAESTRKFAQSPHKFVQISYKPTMAIMVPSVSSERRTYIPMGFLDEGTIISNAANAIYDAELWLFAILESKMHMTWIRTVCGKLKTDYRYSSTLGYNTFPCYPLTAEQKKKLTRSAENILMARENHTEMTLAEMYDPDKMPDDLRKAHEENDVLADKLYHNHAFASDEDRLAVLFDLYEKMTSK